MSESEREEPRTARGDDPAGFPPAPPTFAGGQWGGSAVPPPPSPPNALTLAPAAWLPAPPPPGRSEPMPREDSLAIASAVLGVASVAMGCCVSFLALFPGIAALICGVMGLKSTSQRPAAIVGIVLGSLSVVGGCAYLGLLGFSIVAPALSPR